MAGETVLTDRFEIGFNCLTGEKVDFEISESNPPHLLTAASTGAGKTATLETLARRIHGLKVVVFLTKPDEKWFRADVHLLDFFEKPVDRSQVEDIVRIWYREEGKGSSALPQSYRKAIYDFVKKKTMTLKTVQNHFRREKGLVAADIASALDEALSGYPSKTTSELSLEDGINVMDLSNQDVTSQSIYYIQSGHTWKNVEPAQELVPEDELAERLALGWVVRFALPSGKVVVERGPQQ